MPCPTSPCSGDWTFTRAYESRRVCNFGIRLDIPKDCVGDGAGEAAVLRLLKGFHRFIRFPNSFVGIASIRTFGGKRYYHRDVDSCP